MKGNILSQFPGNLRHTRIRESKALAECSPVGRTIFVRRDQAGAAQDCRKLAKDIGTMSQVEDDALLQHRKNPQ